jgi:hypothetical protein
MSRELQRRPASSIWLAAVIVSINAEPELPPEARSIGSTLAGIEQLGFLREIPVPETEKPRTWRLRVRGKRD